MGKLSSWTCKGCTNICYRILNGEVFTYCRPVIEKGSHRTRWEGDFINCLDKTTDPKAEDKQVKMYGT